MKKKVPSVPAPTTGPVRLAKPLPACGHTVRTKGCPCEAAARVVAPPGAAPAAAHAPTELDSLRKLCLEAMELAVSLGLDAKHQQEINDARFDGLTERIALLEDAAEAAMRKPSLVPALEPEPEPEPDPKRAA